MLTIRRWVRAGVTAGLAVAALLATGSAAQAGEMSDTYTRTQVHDAAKWVSEHGGRAGGLGGLLGAGSAACGAGAPVCGGLVAFWSGTYGLYSDAITTASDHNACLYVYSGDSTSGADASFPYVHEVNDATCHN